MAALILLAILFLCSLFNSYYYYPIKFSGWLSSLLSNPSLPKTSDEITKEEKKEEDIVAINKANLEMTFSTFDRNGDGFITLNELEDSLRRVGLFSTSKEVSSMMERVDANGDGLIDLEEFRKLYDSVGRTGEVERGKSGDGRVISGREEEEEEEEMELMMEAFDVFDGNGDGLISAEELGLVLMSLGLKQGTKAENCEEMIRKADLDGDGMVNFEEFKKMMMVKGGKSFSDLLME